MKKLVALAVASLIGVASLAHADTVKKSAAMDPKEMQEMMMKMATPGPEHERLKKLEGNWDATVTYQMDSTQPAQTETSSATITTLMDGRYSQEQTTGMMMGMPFSGLGLTGYDRVTKKFVSVWLDNMGTGIMNSEGTLDASGNVINWTGNSSDPMTGKPVKYRMVTRFVDDDHHVFEMYGKDPKGKEMKMMTISYARKAS